MSNNTIPKIFLTCLLSCMPCLGYPASPTSTAVVSPTTQKVHRAAFDLGSGLFKVAVAEIDPESKQVKKILAERMMYVPLGDGFNKYGAITPEMEEQAVEALQELIKTVKKVAGDGVEMKGVATAIFRKAGDRGVEVLNRLNQVMGGRPCIKEISAEAEGKVGLKTARIVAVENNPERSVPNVSWDSGNASFQVCYENTAGFQVFGGNIGNSDARALFMTEILEMPQYDVDEMTYQPVSAEQIQQFVTMLKDRFPDADESLKQALGQENGHAVTIGDKLSLFSLAQSIIGKNIYTKAEVGELLNSLINRTDTEDLKAKCPANIAYIIPYTAFLYSVMDKLNINSIENYVTAGGTKGLLVTPELWQE